jgi:hypothetical protein
LEVVKLTWMVEPMGLVRVERAGLAAALLRLGDRRDELGRAATFDDPLCRLSLLIQLPMASGIFVGSVQDRLREEAIVHRRL